MQMYHKLSLWLEKPYASLLFFICYRLCLDFNYVFYVTTVYGYYGYVFVPSVWRWIFSLFLAAVTYLFVKDTKNAGIADTIVNSIILFAYTPLTTYYGLSGQNSLYILYVSCCFVFVRFLLEMKLDNRYNLFCKTYNKVVRTVTSLKCGVKKYLYYLSHAGIIVACTVCTGATLYALYISGNADAGLLTALDIERIYEVREKVKFAVWMKYCVVWQVNAINPFMAAYFTYYKKYYLISIPVILQIVIYLLTGNRAFFFIIFFWLLYYFLMRTEKPVQFLSGLLALGSLGISLLYSVSALGRVLYGLYWRIFFIQPRTEYGYFNFFQNHAHLFFSESRVGRLLEVSSPYPINSARLIGMNLDGTVANHANTGFLAAAFADMNFLGMLIISVLFFITLLYADRVFSNIPIHIVLSSLIYPFYCLTNCAFLTSFFTGGMAMQLFLFTLLAFGIFLKDETKEAIVDGK